MKIKIELTQGEVNHLMGLIEDNEREGCYWGNKEQHWNRSERLKNKLIPSNETDHPERACER